MIMLAALLGSVVLALGVGSGAVWAQDDPAAQEVRGTLTFDGDPVPGVVINVFTADGDPVGSGESAADGTWSVVVPDSGDYRVELDQSTLPDGVRAARGDVRELTVPPGRSSNILFPLEAGQAPPPGTPTAPGEQPGDEPPAEVIPEDPEAEVEVIEGRGQLDRVVSRVYSGIHLGLIIAMAGLGLSLVFGTMGLINFSHGELVSFGALAAVVFHVIGVVGFQLPLLIATPAAVALGALFGYLQDRFFWGWLRNRGTGLIAMMIISIGVALLLRNAYQYYFGSRRIVYRDFASQTPIEFGPLLVPPRNLIVDVIALAVLLAVALSLLLTRLGKATRAVADNPSLASASGINVDRIIRLVWAAGAGLAALAGVFLAMQEGASFIAGFQMLLLIFAAVIVGGLGTAFGAIVGGLAVGLFAQVSTLWIPNEFKYVAALGLLIVVLLVRPQGILGRRVRVG
jgi:branched-chain amino acid transport system permease protein